MLCRSDDIIKSVSEMTSVALDFVLPTVLLILESLNLILFPADWLIISYLIYDIFSVASSPSPVSFLSDSVRSLFPVDKVLPFVGLASGLLMTVRS